MESEIEKLFSKLQTIAVLALGKQETDRIMGTGGPLTKAINIAEALPTNTLPAKQPTTPAATSLAKTYAPLKQRSDAEISATEMKARSAATLARLQTPVSILTRADFGKLSAKDQSNFCRAGGKII